jgi:GDP-mannose 6-dehydrogenase
MNISIFGLGYVGCISLGCLAQSGHSVIGVDITEAKVRLISQGKPTILENRISEIIAAQHQARRIRATTDHKDAVINSDISIICVGTPSSASGQLDLGQIMAVARQIGATLKEKVSFHTIVIRSTVPPGTNQQVTQILEEISGKQPNVHFGVVSNPEFLREGSAVADYYNPPVTLIGTHHPVTIAIMEKLYQEIGHSITKVDVAVAEMIKYVNNSFHALKVSFANEIGNICKKQGIDAHALMDIFCRDHVLNISSAYLKPGFAYGGACLPKDLKALTTMAHDFYLETPIINAIARSNDLHKTIVLDKILTSSKKRIGILGLSFKQGTDDLRNSPAVEIIEQLLGKGYHILVHDSQVVVSKLMGANKDYIQKHLPHISRIIFDDLDHVISNSELLVVTHNRPEYSDLPETHPHKTILDLARISAQSSTANYEGISW